MHVNTYIPTYTQHTYTHTNVQTYTHIYMHQSIRTYMRIANLSCMIVSRACICVCACVCVCVCVVYV